MNRNAAPGRAPVPPATPPRHRGALLAVLLLLFLVLGGGGLYLFRDRIFGGITTTRETPSTGPVVQAPACSDDADPKELAKLNFGDPIVVPFDRQFLDALPNTSIPDLERYPWLPDKVVAIFGEHRMRGDLFAAHPGGKTLAMAATGSPFIRFGDVETVHEKQILVCPAGVRVMTWSADGKTLAVSCFDNQVRLFGVQNLDKPGAPVGLDKPGVPITSLSMSGDGKYLIGGDSSAGNRDAIVWDLGTNNIVRKLPHIGPVMSVALSPVPGDYRALTAGGIGDGKIRLWDVATGQKQEVVPDVEKGPVTPPVAQVGFSFDGKRALSCHPDMTVRIWDLAQFATDKEVLILKGTAGTPQAVFSPDGKSVASTRYADGGVTLWDLQKGPDQKPFKVAFSGSVFSLQFLGGGDRLAFTGTISNDQNVHIHETATGKEIKPPHGHLAGVGHVALAPDGGVIASGGDDLQLRLWDLKTVQQRHVVGIGPTDGVGFHPDSKRVFSHGPSGVLNLTDSQTGQSRTPPYPAVQGGGMVSAAITRDGRYAVTGGGDGTVCMWSLEDGRQVRLFRPGPGFNAAATVTLAPDMRRAIRVGGPRTQLLQLRCQEVVHEWEPVAWAPFLPDGQAVFFGGPKDPIWTISAEKPVEAGSFPLELKSPGPRHLSPDGKRVAVVLGPRVLVFDLESARELWSWTPPNHFGGVRGVALSTDGGHLLTANGDGTVYVIRLP